MKYRKQLEGLIEAMKAEMRNGKSIAKGEELIAQACEVGIALGRAMEAKERIESETKRALNGIKNGRH